MYIELQETRVSPTVNWMDSSPSFTVVITLSMMLFSRFVLFCPVLFILFCLVFFHFFFILVSFFLVGGAEVFLRVPVMNRHQSTLS